MKTDESNLGTSKFVKCHKILRNSSSILGGDYGVKWKVNVQTKCVVVRSLCSLGHARNAGKTAWMTAITIPFLMTGWRTHAIP